MPLTGKQLYKWALKNGWELERVTGSHHIVIKNNKSVSIPVHSNKDLKKGLEHRLKKELKYK